MTSSVPTGQGATDDYFDIDKFEQLLSRLEGSKGRQQRQKSLESRRDIYAQGLASMMSNFWWLNKMTSSVPVGQTATDDYFDINKFEQLLSRLEGSKGRQQRQKSLESRRDIYSQGLASMMSNFWFFLVKYIRHD